MATITSIQRGSFTIANGATSNTATITAVTVANSFVTASYSFANNEPVESMYGIEITNTTTITGIRQGSVPVGAATITIYFEVVEYSSGVTTQNGQHTWTTSGTRGEDDITLSAVTVAQTYPHNTRLNNAFGSGTNADDFESAAITTTTNMKIKQRDTASEDGIVYWQVIDNDDVTIQTASPALGTSTTGTTGTITAVNLSNTYIKSTWQTQSGTTADLSDNMARTKLTSTTAWTFDRDNTNTNSMDGEIYFVEQANTAVQSGEEAFTSTQTTKTPSITSVDTSVTFVTCGGREGFKGKGSYSSDDDLESFSCELSFTATVLTLTRNAHQSSTLDIPWYIVEEDAGGSGATGKSNPLDGCLGGCLSGVL